MPPSLVIPLNDPANLLLPQLKTVTPQLKAIFDRAYVSVDPDTARSQDLTWIETDSFFQLYRHPAPLSVGRDFHTLYTQAANASPDNAILHLCFIDRVAYSLQSEHCQSFTQDMQASAQLTIPLIYERSESAWATHPTNYRALEETVRTTGQVLFGKSLDFAWCHIAVPALQLRRILPHVHRADMSLLAEIVLALRDTIQTQSVDWLAWEDPFIFNRNAAELKTEREHSPTENRKRLGYVIPMLQLLADTLKAA